MSSIPRIPYLPDSLTASLTASQSTLHETGNLSLWVLAKATAPSPARTDAVATNYRAIFFIAMGFPFLILTKLA